MNRTAIAHVITALGAALVAGGLAPGAPPWIAPIGAGVVSLGQIIAGHAAVTKGGAS